MRIMPYGREAGRLSCSYYSKKSGGCGVVILVFHFSAETRPFTFAADDSGEKDCMIVWIV